MIMIELMEEDVAKLSLRSYDGRVAVPYGDKTLFIGCPVYADRCEVHTYPHTHNVFLSESQLSELLGGRDVDIPTLGGHLRLTVSKTDTPNGDSGCSH